MHEPDRLRLVDVLERIGRIEEWVEDLSENGFLADHKTRDAAALNLQVIGEAARRMSEAARSEAPNIPWPQIVALRNRIAHGYEGVDHANVWKIIKDDLPALREAITALLAKDA